MRQIAVATSLLGILLVGAIFGFFYAWICSTMWGLDATDPRVAIQAMQDMNASVRNIVFMPAFFATPFVLIAAGMLALRAAARAAAGWFVAAGLLYLFGGMILTFVVNVPMNEALALLEVPETEAEARAVWEAYSQPWQRWNLTRTVFSGLALLCAAIGLYRLGAAKVTKAETA